jgi:hypothetical protein
MNTVKKSKGNLTDASKEVETELNAGKTKYALLSLHINVKLLKQSNRSFANVVQSTLTHYNGLGRNLSGD